MKLIGVRQALLVAGLVVGASCCACSHHATATNHTPAALKNGPEDSFKIIADTFKRRVEDTPVGFVASDPTQRSTMIGTNKVKSELIPPANPGDPYKAVITVQSQSAYSIKRMKDSADEKVNDKDPKNNKDDQSVLPKDEKKGDVNFDPAFTGKPGSDNKSSRATDDAVARHPDQENRKYELLYENGRWKLITELNKDTEQSIQNAFKNALDTQI